MKAWLVSTVHLSGDIEEVIIDEEIAFGIQDTEKLMNLSNKLSNTPVPISHWTQKLLDSTLGMVICWALAFLIMVSAGLILIPTVLMTQLNTSTTVIHEKTVIFHNAKFDMAFFEYHFHFKFPNFEDTMLLHYLVDENPGGHGLKAAGYKAYSLWRL